VLVPSSALVYRSSDRALTESDPLAPASPYGVSKLAQEMLAARTNGALAVAIARPFNHFGPRQDPFFAASGFARRIADIERGRWAPEISVGNLDARRDLTDVRDTVRAYRSILERGVPGRPYNVCTGHAIPIRELLDRLLARARVPIEVKTDPARLRPNDTPLLLGDPTRLRDELGWTPAIPLDQTLDDLLAYWRNQT
jgi:GDP-4-dehydro-6-deoxy-D-mannose reductase